jgi:hypothetical protein
MPANLKIWGPEPPAGVGRALKHARPDDVEWHAVTIFEDGGEEWKSSDPDMEATRVEVADRMYVKKWLRNDPDARVWRGPEEFQRPKTKESEKELEPEQARADGREAHNRKELAVRRLMGTTVKRLAAAVNRVKVEPAGLKAPMVTTRELRAAFKEFLLDATKDKAFKKAWEYRQWLWTDRNTVYLAPVGRRKRGGSGAGGRVTGSGKTI